MKSQRFKSGFIVILSILYLFSVDCKRKHNSSSSDNTQTQSQQGSGSGSGGSGGSGGSAGTGGSSGSSGGSSTPTTVTTFLLANCHKSGVNPDSPELYLSINGGTFEQLVADGNFHGLIDISTNGKYVAYNRKQSNAPGDTTSDIYVMRLSDKSETRITNDNYEDQHPSFVNDADGNPIWVIWSSERNNIANIYAQRIDGSGSGINITPQADRSVSHWDPDVSPDGKLIVYSFDIQIYTTCATLIKVGELNATSGSISEISNVRTVSGTNPIVRTDPSFIPSTNTKNSPSTQVIYDVFDRDISAYPLECWFTTGWTDGYQHYWKIKRVGINGENKQVVYQKSSAADPATWLPIVKSKNNSGGQSNFFVIGTFVKSGGQTGIFAGIHEVDFTGTLSTFMSEVTSNCVWYDYVRLEE
ncbi:MAG: hypothetical protein HY606_12195 [Planctomycetes bacterium]|nr:hypothetical protein [Planctomycetota bacterium]